MTLALHEKCQNTELFLVLVFLYSDCIRKDTEYLDSFHAVEYNIYEGKLFSVLLAFDHRESRKPF